MIAYTAVQSSFTSVDCYIWLCWYVQQNNNNELVCWSMMMDYVNLSVEFVVMSVSICSPKNNYYTIISSIYIHLGDAIDGSI